MMVDMEIIGLIYKSTGEVRKDEEGVEYPITAPIVGWHVNTQEEVSAWDVYRVNPDKPSRVYNGKPAFYYAFPDEVTFNAIMESIDEVA